MKGLYAWVGFRQATVAYDVEARARRRIEWSLWRLWRLAIDGITSFSALPLKVWSVVGLVVRARGVRLRRLPRRAHARARRRRAGYASLMVMMLFLGGLQLLSLGVIGEYLGRVYDEVKARPLYVVQRRFGFDADDRRLMRAVAAPVRPLRGRRRARDGDPRRRLHARRRALPLDPVARDRDRVLRRVLVGFALNRRWTFGSRADPIAQLPRYLAVQLVGLALNARSCSRSHVQPGRRTSGLGLAIVLVPPVTFALNHYWVFRPRT